MKLMEKNRIREILFPVVEGEVNAVWPPDYEKDPRPVPGWDGRPIPIPGKKVLINAENGRILGVVGRGYQLVTNEQALEWAHQCCAAAFPETKPSEWAVEVAYATRNRSHCVINLVHQSRMLNFDLVSGHKIPETFGPFIQVINSYNGTRALAYRVGFYRLVCHNGLILSRDVIDFKINHSQRNIEQKIKFEIAKGRFVEQKRNFLDYMRTLQDCPVRAREATPLLRSALGIRQPKIVAEKPSIRRNWERLLEDLDGRCAKYRRELGGNAYAVLNAITDVASRPPSNSCLRKEPHNMQRLAGQWVSEFSEECRAPEFSVPGYLSRNAEAWQTIPFTI